MAGVFTSAVAGLAVVLAASAPAWGQDANDDLRKEVEALKEKVKALEQDKAPTPAEPKKDLMKFDGKDEETVLDILLRETKIGGFVDVAYVFNFDRPDNGENGNTIGGALPSGSVRTFDQRSRSFYLHNAQLNLKRDATKELITGYNVELMFGSDANVVAPVNFGGASASNDYIDIQEANIQILAPVGNGLDIRIGKFATLAGYEVIEAKDNFNYSRSLAFYYAIPFTHTGVRASYTLMEQLTLTLGVNNGWDTLEDNNDGKTLEFQALVKPTPWLTFSAVFYYGAEKNAQVPGHDPGDKRWLADFVLTVSNLESLKGWTFGLNLDIAEDEETSLVDASATGVPEDGEWLAFAAYVKYQFHESWAGVVRYSMIDDKDAVRTGGFQPLVGPLEENQISEVTLTLEHQLSKDTIARLEYRMDMSDEDVFLDGQRADDSQSTLAAEFILVF